MTIPLYYVDCKGVFNMQEFDEHLSRASSQGLDEQDFWPPKPKVGDSPLQKCASTLEAWQKFPNGCLEFFFNLISHPLASISVEMQHKTRLALRIERPRAIVAPF